MNESVLLPVAALRAPVCTVMTSDEATLTREGVRFGFRASERPRYGGFHVPCLRTRALSLV